MKTRYPIHPDFKRWSRFYPPRSRPLVPLIQGTLRLCGKFQFSSEKIAVTTCKIPSFDGKSIDCLLFTPPLAKEGSPCLVYFHGGGFVTPAAPYHYRLAKEYALRLQIKVLFVRYRLAPKHPFPIPVKDCYSAFRYAYDNAIALGIDGERIAVGGDSAGGNLAAAVCLAARKGKSMPCAQLLIYPVTAWRLDTPSMRQFTDTPMCNSRNIAYFDKLYVQEEVSQAELPYISPLSAPLHGLPPTYVETAEFDCLMSEGQLFAERLQEAGVPTQTHHVLGAMHGFDIVKKSAIVADCVDRRVAFLRRYLCDKE